LFLLHVLTKHFPDTTKFGGHQNNLDRPASSWAFSSAARDLSYIFVLIWFLIGCVKPGIRRFSVSI